MSPQARPAPTAQCSPSQLLLWVPGAREHFLELFPSPSSHCLFSPSLVPGPQRPTWSALLTPALLPAEGSLEAVPSTRPGLWGPSRGGVGVWDLGAKLC